MSEKQREYGDLLLTLMGERLVVLIEKDVDQALFLVPVHTRKDGDGRHMPLA